jgi:hypothetical protein
MKRLTLPLLAAVVVLSCTDDQPPTTSPLAITPQPFISDGAHGGNPHFYWLPELVESPVYTGIFNPFIPARVRICVLADASAPTVLSEEPTPPSDPVCVGNDIELFGPMEFTADPVTEQYSANWKTDDPLPAELLPGESFLNPDNYYRLSVWVGVGPSAIELGYRDLDPEASPPAGSTPKLEEFFPFKIGNAINIKARIEEGALCIGGDPENCGECLYSTSGGDDGNNNDVGRACNAGPFAGVFIPAGNPDIDNVLVIPEFIQGEVTLADGRTLNCTPDADGRVDFISGLALAQYPGCFTVRTIPELNDPDIDLNAIVGICPEIPDSENLHPVLAQTDDATNPGFVRTLKPASTVVNGVDFLECQGPGSPLQNLVHQAWRRLSPFHAEPAYAEHKSLKGGDVPSFSDFVWVDATSEAIASGDLQTGLVNTTLPEPLTVNVTDLVPQAYWDPDGSRSSVAQASAGAEVTFSLPGVGGLSLPAADNSCSAGAATELTVVTGPSGDASVCLTLPSQPGQVFVDAGGFGIGVTGAAWSFDVDGEILAGTGPYSHYALGSPLSTPTPIPLPSPPVNVTFTATACSPGQGSASVDGVLSPGEWDCAKEPPIEFEANVGGGKKPALAFQMQSDGNLYLAVLIPVDETASLKENTLTFYLNDSGAAQLTEGDDVWVVDGTAAVGSQFSDQYWAQGNCPKGQSFCAFDDVDAGGTADGTGAFQLNYVDGNPAFYFYEIQHPLCSGDPQDICFSGTLDGAFTIRGLGKGAKGNSEQPGPFGVYEPYIP